MIETLIAFTILVNAQRVTPLVPDVELSKRAQVRAEYLCANQQWSHEGYTKSFKGLPLKGNFLVGENLFCTAGTGKGGCSWSNAQPAPADIMKLWMNSPSHKANIVNPRYTRIGIGQACGVTVELFSTDYGK